MKVCVVKVASYDNKVLTGSLYNPSFLAEVPFVSTVDLFLRMDSVFDETHTPRTTLKRRSFTDAAVPVSDTEQETVVENPLATFHIRVHFRQNASWQGTIQWVEQNPEASFRSVLELMYLINSALEPGEAPEDE